MQSTSTLRVRPIRFGELRAGIVGGVVGAVIGATLSVAVLSSSGSADGAQRAHAHGEPGSIAQILHEHVVRENSSWAQPTSVLLHRHLIRENSGPPTP